MMLDEEYITWAMNELKVVYAKSSCSWLEDIKRRLSLIRPILMLSGVQLYLPEKVPPSIRQLSKI